ncbi:hypothetical protein OIU84_021706 [Salix udensis]|uniref:Uncharacterized protein n=1 Tax=Salix udensis TaxID=889485 RepID=A0AAD6KVA7_9ROSI|nr:hypothetical protein OIU84_021706 [Salix udensis]
MNSKTYGKGILVSSLSIGIWLAAYISNEIHDDIRWLQVASRMLLLIMASVLVLVFLLYIKFTAFALAN